MDGTPFHLQRGDQNSSTDRLQLHLDRLVSSIQEHLLFDFSADRSTAWLSLCIIQDSKDDWAKEAGKMAHVYGHADCTIAYLLPPQDVFTKPRQDPRIWSPCIIRNPSLASRGVYIRPNVDDEIYLTEKYPPEHSNLDWLLPIYWPLFARAWVCQEFLLSPRIVFAGHRNLMWECSESLCDELLGPMEMLLTAAQEDPISTATATASKTQFSTVRSVKLPVTTMAAQLKLVQDWGRLVCHYRAGVLTQPKDRIMAFAGIAQAVHDSSKMTYLAGSWAQLFPYSFTWSVARDPDHTSTEVEPVIEGVPSWSWFSVPRSSHHALEFYSVDCMLDMLETHGSITPMYQATLHSYEDRSQQAYADSSPTKAFHDFTGMTLNLTMKIWDGFPGDSPYFLERGLPIGDQFDEVLGDKYGYLQHRFDHKDTVRNYPDNVMTFGLLAEVRTGGKPEYGEPYLVGLIMQPKPNCEAYKRIGVWKLCFNEYPSGWDAEKFNSVSIFDQLEDVRSEHIRLV